MTKLLKETPTFEILLAIAVWTFAYHVGMLGKAAAPGYWFGILMIFVVASIGWIRMFEFMPDPEFADSSWPASVDEMVVLPTPWEGQRNIMQLASQALPTTPQITKATMTYLYGVLEEVGETFEAVAKAVPEDRKDLAGFRALMEVHGGQVRKKAQTLKDTNELTGDLLDGLPLTGDSGVDVFDGIVDATLFAVSAACASGLPGEAGFWCVIEAQYSKRNPETGAIDIDDSGKMIKGPNYQAADLEPILAAAHARKGS